ncbi:MAG: hypothetical protein MUE46_08440 [Xanthomonadales bacterium]|jgi:hypothetical protein|nr:hypothetical protein [Xanthomonadales bacterium]
MSNRHKVYQRVRLLIVLTLLIFGVPTNASSAQLLDLHDANGPTQLRAFFLGLDALSVVSSQGYGARVTFSGKIDGYFSTSGHYTDASCTDGPYRRAGEAIPGFVFRNGASGIAYVPTDANTHTFTSGQQVFFLDSDICVVGSVFETGVYFLALQNDPAITGIKDVFAPPLRLRPVASAGSQCVFSDGFECVIQVGESR